jgi:hypothetical protein
MYRLRKSCLSARRAATCLSLDHWCREVRANERRTHHANLETRSIVTDRRKQGDTTMTMRPDPALSADGCITMRERDVCAPYLRRDVRNDLDRERQRENMRRHFPRARVAAVLFTVLLLAAIAGGYTWIAVATWQTIAPHGTGWQISHMYRAGDNPWGYAWSSPGGDTQLLAGTDEGHRVRACSRWRRELIEASCR